MTRTNRRILNLACAASCGMGAYFAFYFNGDPFICPRRIPAIDIAAGGTAIAGLYHLKEAVLPSVEDDEV